MEKAPSIKLIRLTDLQSIKKIELPFEESGVFRLDGNNDIGKSAILRGISALFQNVNNRQYKDYISDWADSFEVEAFFYDGSWIKLSRGSVDFYEWSLPSGGDRAENTKGKVPEPVEEFLNLYSEQERTKQVLNFNLPGSPLPFVDTSNLDNYWLLQQALGTEDFLKGTKVLNSRVRDTNKEIKLVFELVEQQNEKLEHITVEIDNDKNKLRGIERFEDILKVEYAALNDMYVLENQEQEIEDLRQTLAEFIQVPDEEFNNMVQEGQVVTLMDETFLIGSDVQQLQSEYKTVTSKLTSITDLDGIAKEIEDISLAEEHYLVAKELQQLQEEMERLEETLKAISDVEYLESSMELILLAEQQVGEQSAYDEKMEEYIVLKGLEKVYADLDSTHEMVQDIEQLELLFKGEKAIAGTKEELQEQVTAIETLSEEIEQLKVELGVCPFCGSDLTIAHAHK